jgi:hypothetical protein
LRDLGQITRLEERVARVRGEAAEEVRAEHRRDHRPVAAGGLAGDAAVLRNRQGAIALVHPRDDLVAEICVVAARSRRVQELAPAERRPAVDVDQDRGGHVSSGEEVVRELGEVLAERGTISPHVELARKPLDDINRRVSALGVVVVAGREVDPERPRARVAERIPLKSLALHLRFLEAAARLERPRLHGRDPSRG